MATPKRKKPKKPSKPYPSFPLTAHNNSQWCKKIRGRVRFFGVWNKPQPTLEDYLRVTEDIHTGHLSSIEKLPSGAVIVKDICNQYLTHQLEKAETNEIQP